MQIPRSMSSPKDPFIFKDGAMMMPMMGPQSIPIEQQEPHMDQYNLGIDSHRAEINSLLQRSFKKEVILWSMDKNWTKDGDCVVVVFYSVVLKEKPKKEDPEAVSVGVTTPQKFSMENIEKKEAELFDEFMTTLEDMKSEQ